MGLFEILHGCLQVFLKGEGRGQNQLGYVGACGGFALQIEGIGQNGVAHQHPVASHQSGGAGRHCQKMPGKAGGDALGGVRVEFRHPHQSVLQLRVRIHIIQRFFLFRPGHVPEIQVGLHGNKAKVFHFACFRVQGVQFYAADFAVQRAGDQKLVFPVGGKGHGADLYAAVQNVQIAAFLFLQIAHQQGIVSVIGIGIVLIIIQKQIIPADGDRFGKKRLLVDFRSPVQAGDRFRGKGVLVGRINAIEIQRFFIPLVPSPQTAVSGEQLKITVSQIHRLKGVLQRIYGNRISRPPDGVSAGAGAAAENIGGLSVGYGLNIPAIFIVFCGHVPLKKHGVPQGQAGERQQNQKERKDGQKFLHAVHTFLNSMTRFTNIKLLITEYSINTEMSIPKKKALQKCKTF